jgi:MFS family permease
MSFSTLFLQYIGLSDAHAALATAMSTVGCALGSVLGGWLGDVAAARDPDVGRVRVAQVRVVVGSPSHRHPVRPHLHTLTLARTSHSPSPPEQVSVFNGTVLAVAIYHGLHAPLPLQPHPSSCAPSAAHARRGPRRGRPWDGAYWRTYAVLFFAQGLLMSWSFGATNRPIFSELAPSSSRATLLAWEVGIEKAAGAIFGAPLVGWLAEDVFGYDSSVTSEAMEDIAPEVRLRNANALAVGMLVMMVVPWTVCLLAYSGVAYTYPRDREKLRAAQLGLGEKAG